jgi:membrane protease YdiL (CAAX protease family)
MVLACLCTGFWEELLLRGVFITNAMDGLRRRMSPHRAALVAVLISATVFGLPHLAQPEYPVLILTWVFSGLVFGVIYVLSGNLALVIGAHATFNMAANIVFVRADLPGNAGQSALTRVRPDPDITALTPGGVIEASAFVLLGLLALLWLAFFREPLKLRLRPLADPVGDRPERKPLGEPVR